MQDDERQTDDARAARPRFHLAFPVHDLDAARAFYVERLGCREGRSAPEWVDFDLAGHQLAAHLDDTPRPAEPTHDVDGHQVPIRHFGLILSWSDWHALADRLRASGTAFLIEPYVRFAGRPGEQATLFVRDPSGNALEFKSFRDEGTIFATER